MANTSQSKTGLHPGRANKAGAPEAGAPEAGALPVGVKNRRGVIPPKAEAPRVEAPGAEALGAGEASTLPDEITATAKVTQAETVKKRKPRGKAGHEANIAEAEARRLTEATKAATMIKATLEASAIALVGQEAAYSNLESVLIDMSLPPLIADMEEETFKQVQRLAYPLVLTIGLGAWGWRCYTIYAYKAAQLAEAERHAKPESEAPSAVPPEATPPTKDNGNLTGEDSRIWIGEGQRPIL